MTCNRDYYEYGRFAGESFSRPFQAGGSCSVAAGNARRLVMTKRIAAGAVGVVLFLLSLSGFGQESLGAGVAYELVYLQKLPEQWLLFAKAIPGVAAGPRP